MAAKNENEKKDVLGLDSAPDRKEAEYDLVSSLLRAAEYRTSEDEITEVEIKRRGEFLFSVHIHPIGDSDVKKARKEAGIYKPNPANKKLGKVKVDSDDAKFASWIVYLATTEKDQAQIWGQKAVMQPFGLMEPWECVDILLTKGEKDALLEEIFKISGMNDEDEDEQLDDETFQS